MLNKIKALPYFQKPGVDVKNEELMINVSMPDGEINKSFVILKAHAADKSIINDAAFALVIKLGAVLKITFKNENEGIDKSTVEFKIAPFDYDKDNIDVTFDLDTFTEEKFNTIPDHERIDFEEYEVLLSMVDILRNS